MSLSSRAVVAKAPPNIAFLKYWGKRDTSLNLPVADSLAVCLNDFHTYAKVEASSDESDRFVWNGKELAPPHRSRFVRIVNLARERTASARTVRTEITATLPPRIGLAGSSAALAAFALAVSEFFDLAMSRRELSALARIGSGSAARSIPDGFTWWHRGTLSDGTDSYAETILDPGDWPELQILAVLLDTEGKRVSSTDGMMRTSQTSPHFKAWVHQCEFLAPLMEDAIRKRDFEALGNAAQNNAQAMHALCLSATPPILYVHSGTIAVLEVLEQLKREVPLFYTLDAGPNPVVFGLKPTMKRIENRLKDSFPNASLHRCEPGAGAEVVTGNTNHDV